MQVFIVGLFLAAEIDVFSKQTTVRVLAMLQVRNLEPDLSIILGNGAWCAI